jgi:hypothetical protein
MGAGQANQMSSGRRPTHPGDVLREDVIKPLGLTEKQEGRILTGCCPNKNSFERSLKRFLRINLGESRCIAGLERALDLSKNENSDVPL